MSQSDLQIPAPASHRGDQFGFSLFLAVAVHALIIFGIGFSLAFSSAPPPSLEVALSLHQSAEPPEQVDYLAQHNQQGSGDQAEKSQVTTDRRADLPAPITQQANPMNAVLQQRRRSEATAAVTTSSRSARRIADANLAEQDRGDLFENIEHLPSLEVASLEARLDQQRREYSRLPRINRLTAAATGSSEEAAYIYYWVERIEQTGNAHYPDEARRNNIYGAVTVAVTLLPDGSVEKVEILERSGEDVLDQAAIRIVRQSAPFAPFPQELRNWDKFEIIRTWRFIPGNQLTTGNQAEAAPWP